MDAAKKVFLINICLPKNIIQQNTTKYNHTVIHANAVKRINTELPFTITKRSVNLVSKNVPLQKI